MGISFSVTKVKDLMTKSPVMVDPDATLKDAAEKMEDVDCGVLPVGTRDRLKGIITDRDIVIRAIAKGKDPAKEKVSDYMTKEIHACNENDTLEDAAKEMHAHKVSRLVVRDKEGKTSGILSFGCILRSDAPPEEVATVVMHAAGPVVT